jgi:CIC family chloride channel protein
VFCVNFGWLSLFGKVAADYTFHNPLELVPLTALACALALAGYVFVKLQHLTESRMRRIPRWIRPMVGGAIAGTLALAIYLGSGVFSADGKPSHTLFAIMGDGYSGLCTALQGGGIWWVLLLLALGKILASAFTLGGGGAGGYFAPSMVIGGAVGAAMGIVFYQLLPGGLLPAPSSQGELVGFTAVFALVGMAGFWTGVAKVPVSSVIIVCELTGSYHLLLPAMWTCAITFVLSRRYKLYLTQVASRRDSAAHRGDFSVDVLKEIRVAELLPELKNFETISESTTLQQIMGMHASRQAYFPVLTREGKFVGIFSLNDLRAVLVDSHVWQLLVAADIVRKEVVTVRPSQTLAEVASTFAETSYDELPVVDNDDRHKLVGMISRRQLNNAYIKRTMLYDQAARLEHSTGVSGKLP